MNYQSRAKYETLIQPRAPSNDWDWWVGGPLWAKCWKQDMPSPGDGVEVAKTQLGRDNRQRKTERYHHDNWMRENRTIHEAFEDTRSRYRSISSQTKSRVKWKLPTEEGRKTGMQLHRRRRNLLKSKIPRSATKIENVKYSPIFNRCWTKRMTKKATPKMSRLGFSGGLDTRTSIFPRNLRQGCARRKILHTIINCNMSLSFEIGLNPF